MTAPRHREYIQCSVVFSSGVRCDRNVEARGFCHACFEYARRTGKSPNGRRSNLRHTDEPRCCVVFSTGVVCGKRLEVRKFGGVCKSCNRWSNSNGGATPHGRTPAATKAQRAEDFRIMVESLGGTVFGRYAGTRPPVHVVCRKGHDCYPKPVDVLRGSGFCAQCVGKTHDVFYVVCGNGLVKPGITSGNPDGRLRDHAGRYGLTERALVHTSLPEGDARWAESEVLSQLKSLGAKPVYGREFFGEEWTCTVLQLAAWYL